MDEKTYSLAQLLMGRLERISADSFWAHRASGVKGSLLKMLEDTENGRPVTKLKIKRLLEMGFSILKNAVLEKYK